MAPHANRAKNREAQRWQPRTPPRGRGLWVCACEALLLGLVGGGLVLRRLLVGGGLVLCRLGIRSLFVLCRLRIRGGLGFGGLFLFGRFGLVFLGRLGVRGCLFLRGHGRSGG